MDISIKLNCDEKKGMLSTNTLSWIMKDIHNEIRKQLLIILPIELADIRPSNTEMNKALKKNRAHTYIESYKRGSWEIILISVLTGYLGNLLYDLYPPPKRILLTTKTTIAAIIRRIENSLAERLKSILEQKEDLSHLVVHSIKIEIVKDLAGRITLKIQAHLNFGDDFQPEDYPDDETELVEIIKQRMDKDKKKKN